jgi:hypothetical protein
MGDRLVVGDVASWVDRVLDDYKGLYDVQDQVFIRGAVRVVTKRRDSCFDISKDGWTAPEDAPERLALRQELGDWARRVFTARRD